MLTIPLTSNKKNIEKVLASLDFETTDIVFKNWITDDDKNADKSKDYPNQYLFKNEAKKLITWVELNHNNLTVEFQYDCKDIEVEKWILDTNDMLRNKFGESKSPTFHVLARYGSSFDTQEVKTPVTKLNINEHYNDDFEPIHDTITEAICGDISGLILLHGLPGTGKTSYIKGLISEHTDINFIFIQNEFVRNLLDPEFISFLLNQRNSVLVIEDAEKVITSREDVREESVVSTILQLTDGLFNDYLNIKIICTFNSNLSKVDSALMRKGRMIAKYEFKALEKTKTKKLLSSIGIEESNEELTLADVFNYNHSSFQNKENKIGF